MEEKSGKVQFSMCHFRNKQNMLIRTYSATVPNAKGNIVLVHGNCCHFRAEFAAYNIKWYMQQYGIGTPNVKDVVRQEKKAVYPRSHHFQYNDPDAKFPDATLLDGKNMFDISPRFVYEGSFIEKLNKLGYNVYGLDHQSHGLSEGLKGRRNFFGTIEDLVDDVIQFIDIVKRGKFDNTKQTPRDSTLDAPSTVGKVILCGISMGGNIVLRVAQKTSAYNKDGHMFIDGLIAFAPMTDLSDYTSTLCMRMLFGFSRVVALIKPSATLGVKSDDMPRTFNKFLRVQDPHYYVGPQCYRVIVNLFNATNVLRKNHDKFPANLQTLIMHATDDDVCNIRGTYDIVNNHLKKHKYLQFVEMEGNAHCMTSSIYVDSVMPYVEKWLQKLEA
ncbi:uncharacterized protein BXIN_2973 [Babesia sp. Xinjiang]|uniref:uncharacterized protein n=1 Tax=Babesia sp. Xinjiang TaxID=462227 RepID=UPI000A24E496|nr:uncharacterized protein BXIN_2973 [Babesia sp. Xinjiang]ORM39447.1 hypothetical protein BXIN_2973 [Babesia sp. Xinjiang]